MTRIGRFPLLLIALLVLSVGVIGTATASDTVGKLTASKVKKLAKKVVLKQAPSLSVANAAKLGGKAPSSYLNAATIYTSTTAVSATSHVITIPLAPGNYTIGYSVLMVGGTGYSYCQVRRVRSATTINIADATTQPTGTASVSAYGALDVIAGDVVTLRCNSGTAFTIAAAQPAQIVVTPVDTLTTAAPLVAARGTAGRGN